MRRWLATTVVLLTILVAAPVAAATSGEKTVQESLAQLQQQVSAGQTKLISSIGAVLVNLYNGFIKIAQDSKASVEAMTNLYPNEKQLYSDEQDRAINFYLAQVAVVQQATSADQLATSFQAVKTFNDEHFPKVKKITTTIWHDRVAAAADHYRLVSSTFDSLITQLKGLGIDTTKLDSDLATYNANIAAAETEAQKAIDKVDEAKTLDEIAIALAEGETSLDAVVRNLEQAQQIADRMIVQLQNLNLGAVAVAGDGQILAQGSGTARLVGSGGITINSFAGSIQVIDRGTPDGSAVVIRDVQGTGTAERSGNTITYANYTGSMVITGTNMQVELKGEMNIQAGGTGTVTLVGTGTWSANDVRFYWPTRETNITLK